MTRLPGAVVGLAVLLLALLSATVDLHSPAHTEPGELVSVDLAATHAAETGHIESAGDAGDLLCPACLVLLQDTGRLHPDSTRGATLEVATRLRDFGALAPLSGSAGAASSRAPPSSTA